MYVNYVMRVTIIEMCDCVAVYAYQFLLAILLFNFSWFSHIGTCSNHLCMSPASFQLHSVLQRMDSENNESVQCYRFCISGSGEEMHCWVVGGWATWKEWWKLTVVLCVVDAVNGRRHPSVKWSKMYVRIRVERRMRCREYREWWKNRKYDTFVQVILLWGGS